MSDVGFGGAPTMAQLRAILTTANPDAEAVVAKPGTGQSAARDDHQHPRVSSATVQVLDGTGVATVMFTRTFASLPAVACLLYEASAAQPVVFKVRTWVQDAQGNYTGCVIQGNRASLLPSLSGIALLTGLITALSNLNVFGGSAAGAQFCCIALQPSA
jgi:hypothetical protein